MELAISLHSYALLVVTFLVVTMHFGARVNLWFWPMPPMCCVVITDTRPAPEWRV